MKFFNCLTFIALAIVAVHAGSAPEDDNQPTELKIETTYLPDNCDKLEKAKTGDSIKVHYTGTLFTTGAKFDSSRDRGSPLPLTLGIGQVIPGWDEGLQGMCLNEKRILTIPSTKAYGSRGFGSIIPAHSALVFDVELVGHESKGHEEL